MSTGANAINLARRIDSPFLLEAAISAFNRSIFLASAVGGLVTIVLAGLECFIFRRVSGSANMKDLERSSG